MPDLKVKNLFIFDTDESMSDGKSIRLSAALVSRVKMEITTEVVEVAHVDPGEVVNCSKLTFECRPVLVWQMSIYEHNVFTMDCSSHFPEDWQEVDSQSEIQRDASKETAEHDCD